MNANTQASIAPHARVVHSALDPRRASNPGCMGANVTITLDKETRNTGLSAYDAMFVTWLK
jgi:hypothetical protein